MTDIEDVRARQIEQGELWEELSLDTLWFHVMRGQIYRGVIKEFGVMGWAVYSVLKAHTNLNSGEAFPSLQRIADLIGVSHDTVQRAMAKLIELKVVKADKSNKNNRYTLTEKVAMTTRTGALYAVGERQYVGKEFEGFIGQLQRFAKSGNLPPAEKGININVTFNIQNITQGDGGNVTMNVQSVQMDGVESRQIDPAGLAKRLKSL